jgi:hypothetical protein
MRIESYAFGKIVIDGRTYRNDVILHPDYVEGDWWRKQGHQLCVEDIQKAIERGEPDVLVVGEGKYGFMKVLPETEEYLKSMGIRLIAESTDDACETFNQLSGKEKVVGAFHLTC